MNLQGLNKQQVEESRQKHGANTLTQIPPEPLWKKILEGFKDPMIMILLVALVIQVVLCFMGEAHWYEPVGILIAIMIANGVSAISENQQEGKASALKAEEEAKEVAKVLRDGKLMEIHVSEVVVGDLVYLQAGDKISADGEIVEGLVKVDQATLNGETKEATKTVNESGEAYNTKDLLNRCYVYRGTVVCSGEAYMEVKVVGDKTLFGELALEVQEDTRETPLQVKLAKLAKQISTFGYIGAIAIVVGVFARTLLGGNIPNTFMEWVNLSIEAITVAVTIIVCAVPEGLPMLTSILLSYQSMRMAKDNVLVHKINGLETAGSLSLLFSDKTGTITEGRPRVTGMTMLTDTMDETEVLSLAMAAEETSTHPLASAILTYGRAHGAKIPPHGEIVTEVSRGSRTEVDGKCIRVGNLKYMKENGVRADGAIPDANGAIPNYVGVGDKIVAVLYAMDNPRANVRRAINALRYDGVGDIELLTGDMAAQAQAVAEMVGVDGYQAQLLPEQKAEAVLKLQTQGNGVVMVGDGINDAPALAYADVGISLGSKSTDIAMETSDVVINRDDPMMIPELRRLARATMRIVQQNFAMVIGINTVGLILGAASGISVLASALMHNMSTILVVANSLRLMVFPPMEG